MTSSAADGNLISAKIVALKLDPVQTSMAFECLARVSWLRLPWFQFRLKIVGILTPFVSAPKGVDGWDHLDVSVPCSLTDIDQKKFVMIDGVVLGIAAVICAVGGS